MAGDKYIYNNGGVLTEKAATQTSAGAGDAGKIPALDATGKFDSSLMPVGQSSETDQVTASEALAAGDFVNIYASGGVKCRKADGSTVGKEAHGFVLAGVSQNATATVYRISQTNTQKTLMTPGATQYLSVTVPGGTQETAPTGAGQTLQILGKALSATEMTFAPKDPIILA